MKLHWLVNERYQVGTFPMTKGPASYEWVRQDDNLHPSNINHLITSILKSLCAKQRRLYSNQINCYMVFGHCCLSLCGYKTDKQSCWYPSSANRNFDKITSLCLVWVLDTLFLWPVYENVSCCVIYTDDSLGIKKKYMTKIKRSIRIHVPPSHLVKLSHNR